MLYVCWAAKGGVGTSVVASALAGRSAQTQNTLLVDLTGDQPAVLGTPEPDGPGVADWLAAGADAPVGALPGLETMITPNLSLLHRGNGHRGNGVSGNGVSGNGVVGTERLELLAAVLAGGTRPVVVDAGVRDCDEAWWQPGVSVCVVRTCYLSVRRLARLDPATRLVVISEPGRALRPGDVAAAAGVPVWCHLVTDPAVARAVDAGLLITRLPRSLRSLVLPT